ncbi:hypothetical protein I9W82_000122 [Candida metapsilosis]|uniref:Uncharacterized protein n=1 Tax=Candida metapsilosis TaxID=273372 RepID=A0A8H7ZFG4_9ASCO|nr:hypothetical protein I9W82_000122 [Candida metapsilosis]
MNNEFTPNISDSFRYRSSSLQDSVGSPTIEYSVSSNSILLQGGVASLSVHDGDESSNPSAAHIQDENVTPSGGAHHELQPSQLSEFEMMKQRPPPALNQSTPLTETKNGWYQQEPMHEYNSPLKKESKLPYPIYMDEQRSKSRSTEPSVDVPNHEKTSTATNSHVIQPRGASIMPHYLYPLSPDQNSPLSQSTAGNSPQSSNQQQQQQREINNGGNVPHNGQTNAPSDKLHDDNFFTIRRHEFATLLARLSQLERDNEHLVKENERLVSSLHKRDDGGPSQYNQPQSNKSTQTNPQKEPSRVLESVLKEEKSSINENGSASSVKPTEEPLASKASTGLGQSRSQSTEEPTNGEIMIQENSDHLVPPVHPDSTNISERAHPSSSSNSTLVSKNIYPKFDISRHITTPNGPNVEQYDLDKVDHLSHEDLVYCVKTTLAIFVIHLDENFELSLLRQRYFIGLVSRFVKLVHKLMFPKRLDLSCSKWFEGKYLNSEGKIDDQMVGLQCKLNEMLYAIQKDITGSTAARDGQGLTKLKR